MKGAPPRDTAAVGIVVEQLRRRVPGGIGTYARGLLAGLAELADAAPPLRLIASRPPLMPDPLATLGIPLATERLPQPLLIRAWAVGVARLSGYRVVHSTGLDLPATRAPLVVAVHDLLWRELPDAYPRHGRAWHEAALRRARRRAAAFVVPSNEVRDALVEALGATEVREIAVIEEGADNLPPADDEAAAALLKRLGVNGDYLLAVGTLEPRKNLPALVAAYGEARRRLPQPPSLVICGPDGWGDSQVGLGEGVVLSGRVEDATLAALYRGALALASPSLGEGFGLPVAEAMAVGVPVIAGAVPAAGEAALRVNPRDRDAISDALVLVCSDSATRANLAEAGRARAANLTWRRCAEAHVALWDALAEAR